MGGQVWGCVVFCVFKHRVMIKQCKYIRLGGESKNCSLTLFLTSTSYIHLSVLRKALLLCSKMKNQLMLASCCYVSPVSLGVSLGWFEIPEANLWNLTDQSLKDFWLCKDVCIAERMALLLVPFVLVVPLLPISDSYQKTYKKSLTQQVEVSCLRAVTVRLKYLFTIQLRTGMLSFIFHSLIKKRYKPKDFEMFNSFLCNPGCILY